MHRPSTEPAVEPPDDETKPRPARDGGLSRRLVLLAASAGGTMLATGTMMTSCGCCEPPVEDGAGLASGDAGSGTARADAEADRELTEAGADFADEPLAPRFEPTHDPEMVARQRAVEKARDFDSSFNDDVVVIDERMRLLKSVRRRVDRAQRVVGHGHFGLYGFEDLLRAGKRFSKIGKFPPKEAQFLDELFSVSAADYGFFGEKVIDELSFRHNRKDTARVRGTGHHLLRGRSLEVFEKMSADVPSMMLTSGVRGLAKQYQLFLTKVVETQGNLSRAARSLAPPGYSHHGGGDFDVGATSLGQENFTDEFAQTDEYRRLMDLGYVEIRYDQGNQLGVRHEPWHIRIV